MPIQITPQDLINRLDAIGKTLSQTTSALALFGLGSVGKELDRLDKYSDLDFFVIARNGHRTEFLEDLSWLSASSPIAYAFRNTSDGYKVLYADGIFCEFAVFDEQGFDKAVFSPGRWIWKAADAPERMGTPVLKNRPQPQQTQEWLLGEALTNLYIGLLRDHRGEKLSAMRFIQGYAVDRLLDLAEQIEAPAGGAPDAFAPERRFETRFPEISRQLHLLLQGYDRNRESASALLDLLDASFELHPVIKEAVRTLCKTDSTT